MLSTCIWQGHPCWMSVVLLWTYISDEYFLNTCQCLSASFHVTSHKRSPVYCKISMNAYAIYQWKNKQKPNKIQMGSKIYPSKFDLGYTQKAQTLLLTPHMARSKVLTNRFISKTKEWRKSITTNGKDSEGFLWPELRWKWEYWWVSALMPIRLKY